MKQEDISDIMIQSLVLSLALIERFEIMQENGLVAQRAKQSIKTSAKFLEIYVDKVFDVSGEDEETKQHMKKGATHLAELRLRLEKGLKTENLMNISDRKEGLKKLINLAPLLQIQKDELYTKIRDSGIIDY